MYPAILPAGDYRLQVRTSCKMFAARQRHSLRGWGDGGTITTAAVRPEQEPETGGKGGVHRWTSGWIGGQRGLYMVRKTRHGRIYLSWLRHGTVEETIAGRLSPSRTSDMRNHCFCAVCQSLASGCTRHARGGADPSQMGHICTLSDSRATPLFLSILPQPLQGSRFVV